MQKKESNLRAIIQIDDSGSSTFVRSVAGKGWQVLGIIQPPAAHGKIISRRIYESLGLPPNIYYTFGFRIDALHEDDPYIGYLSSVNNNNLTYTPKLYPQDGFEVVLREPDKREQEILHLRGDGYLSLFESQLVGQTVEHLAKLLSTSSITFASQVP